MPISRMMGVTHYQETMRPSSVSRNDTRCEGREGFEGREESILLSEDTGTRYRPLAQKAIVSRCFAALLFSSWPSRLVFFSAAIVLELQRHGEVFAFEESDDGLQVVAAFARHAHRVALDGGLHLREIIADEFRDLARQLARKAAL